MKKRKSKEEEESEESEYERQAKKKKEQKPKAKRFNDKWREDLLAYMKGKPSSGVGDALKAFAEKHDFTVSQVRHNWYEVLVPVLKKKQKDKDLQKLDDDARKYSAEINSADDEEYEEEEEETIQSPSKISKLITKDTITFLKPFRFETDKNRFYVFRYPPHLLFTFQGISYSEKTFGIEVSTRTLFTSDMLFDMIGGFYSLTNLKENTSREKETFELTENLPKDVDYKSVQVGESYHEAFGPTFTVVFDKKVKTFVPSNMYASWSTPVFSTPQKQSSSGIQNRPAFSQVGNVQGATQVQRATQDQNDREKELENTPASVSTPIHEATEEE